MSKSPSTTRYNQPIPHMRARTSSSLRLAWLTLLLLAVLHSPSFLCASPLSDTARQLANKIAAASGSGTFVLEITNRSSLDEQSVREVRTALVDELQIEGVHAAKADQSAGTIAVVLSESLREYVWTAVITVGSDEQKVALVSLPRPPAETSFAATPPLVLKTMLLLAQEQPMLDAALIDMSRGDMSGSPRLLVLEPAAVVIYRHQAANPAARWELEASLPIVHSRIFPRDLRGRLLIRRDRLFDLYLPGTVCRSTTNSPLALACADSDDPWPLTADDNSVRAFYAASRNFFTGVLSPGIGKISNVPSFYSAAALPRSNYALWAFAGVDGSLHLVDGMTDQLIRSSRPGSELAALHSSCGSGTQLLISEDDDSENRDSQNGDAGRDGLRAFEILDRDPVPASSAAEFDGRITALWPESGGDAAIAIVRRKDTGWYEAFRISVSCGN